jgi:Zn-dependent protease
MRITINEEWRNFLAQVWRWVIGIPVLMVMFIASANAAGELVRQGVQGLAFLLFFAILYLCVFAHELGHAVAGMLYGFRVHMFAVGPIAYRPVPRKFSYMTRNQAGDMAGFVVALPPETADWERGRLMLTLGGPLASYAFAALCFGIASIASGVWVPLAGAVAISSAVLGLGATIPSWGPGPRRSDGASIVDRLLGRRTDEPTKRLARLWSYSTDAIDPRKWNRELVAQVESDIATQSNDPVRDLLVVNYHLVGGDLLRVRNILACSPATRTMPALAVAYAFVTALVDRDAKRAGEVLANVPEWRAEKFFDYWRARAAIEVLRGQLDDATKSVKRARAVAKRTKVTPDEQDVELLAALERGELPRGSWAHVRPAA